MTNTTGQTDQHDRRCAIFGAGAVCMQRTWRHRVARLAHLKRLAFASGVLVCGWLIATDSRTRALFWYRPADDKLTWVKSNIGRRFESLAPRTRDLEKTFLFFCVLFFFFLTTFIVDVLLC